MESARKRYETYLREIKKNQDGLAELIKEELGFVVVFKDPVIKDDGRINT